LGSEVLCFVTLKEKMAHPYFYKTATENESRIHKVEIENDIPISWEINYGNKVEIPKSLVKYYSPNKYGYEVEDRIYNLKD